MTMSIYDTYYVCLLYFPYDNNFGTFFLQDLAGAGATKRPTCCVLVLTSPTKGSLSEEEDKKLKEDYSEVVKEVRELATPFF